MNRIAIGIILGSVLLGIAPFAADYSLVEKEEFSFDSNASVYNATGNRTKNLGVVTEPNLDFGRIPQGSSTIKFINVDAPNKSILTLSSSGNISEHLIYGDKQYFEGEKELRVRFNGSQVGYFTGSLDVNAEMPRNRWGMKWLELKNYFY